MAVAVVVLATGCSSGGQGGSDDGAAPGESASASPTPSPTPAPPPRATEPAKPKKDTCHRLSFSEAVAPTADLETVACKKAHTSETYAVGRVDNVVDGHLLAIDSSRVQEQVATTCPGALQSAVGGTLDDARLSMLRAVWFTPTVEESDAGSDWYRCDVVALAGADKLVSVRGSLAGALDTPAGRTTYGMCGTASPDEKSFERVPCSRTHSWRAISVVGLPAGDYPGADAIADAGSTPCQDTAADRAADPLDYEWAFEGPDRAQWKVGQTFIRCWAPD
ncbi:septum formation family protein [Nocardioides sp.]|uniref:septum formation family protein n=1 Tax=Nocardioides sp. TaxID=35761 RepID=UPI002B27AB71|nr:septum formation family protein [Nocardioides sp.]